MNPYRSLLAVIDLSPEGEHVARRALAMARQSGATLRVATVAPQDLAEESSHVPFLTPRQARAALCRDLTRRLDHLLRRIGAEGTCFRVVEDSLDEILTEWAPELVLVGSHETFRLEERARRLRGHGSHFDLLVVHVERRRGFTGRLVHALVAAF